VLNEPTYQKLIEMRLIGMAEAHQAQLADPEAVALDFATRLGLIVEAEALHRDNRRLTRYLKMARLRIPGACMEDLKCSPARGLDLALARQLMTGRWLDENLNVIITGPTGTGKTYAACALAQHACRQGRRTLYRRLSLLIEEMMHARASGTYTKLLDKLARQQLLVIDDWGIAPLDDAARRDVLEVLDDRYMRRSTIITSQLPVKHWHDYIGEPTVADAILDRVVHNAYKIELKGKSMRTREVADHT